MSVNLSIATMLAVLLGAMRAPAQQLAGAPANRYNHFTKGVNLTNWFECMDGEAVPCSSTNTAYVPITASDIQIIASVGLNYVRLCVDPLSRAQLFPVAWAWRLADCERVGLRGVKR
jgi:hypothetical protein